MQLLHDTASTSASTVRYCIAVTWCHDSPPVVLPAAFVHIPCPSSPRATAAAADFAPAPVPQPCLELPLIAAALIVKVHASALHEMNGSVWHARCGQVYVSGALWELMGCFSFTKGLGPTCWRSCCPRIDAHLQNPCLPAVQEPTRT
jgi:hypothetical protein